MCVQAKLLNYNVFYKINRLKNLYEQPERMYTQGEYRCIFFQVQIQVDETTLHFFLKKRKKKVAAIFVGVDGAPPVYQHIVGYPQGQQKQRISYFSYHLNPMIHPILFPNGEQSWHINMEHVQEYQTRVYNKQYTLHCFSLSSFSVVVSSL